MDFHKTNKLDHLATLLRIFQNFGLEEVSCCTSIRCVEVWPMPFKVVLLRINFVHVAMALLEARIVKVRLLPEQFHAQVVVESQDDVSLVGLVHQRSVVEELDAFAELEGHENRMSNFASDIGRRKIVDQPVDVFIYLDD